MKLKKKTFYWKHFKFVLTYPADCEIWIENNIVRLSLKNQTATVILDLVKPKISGNIPVVIRTPYNFLLIHKP